MPPLPKIAATLRFLMVTMLGAYLALNALLWLVRPFSSGWPVEFTTALTVPPMVLAMIYFVVPFAQRVRERWDLPRSGDKKHR